MRNPCLSCDLKNENKIWDSRCKNCNDRISYVAAIGDRCSSVPDRMTNMCGHGYGNGGYKIMPSKDVDPVENMITAACRRSGIETKSLRDPKCRLPAVVALRSTIAGKLAEDPYRLSVRQSAQALGCSESSITIYRRQAKKV